LEFMSQDVLGIILPEVSHASQMSLDLRGLPEIPEKKGVEDRVVDDLEEVLLRRASILREKFTNGQSGLTTSQNDLSDRLELMVAELRIETTIEVKKIDLTDTWALQGHDSFTKRERLLLNHQSRVEVGRVVQDLGERR